MKKIKVAVGISGGVDSALAAALLKEQDYEVTGIFYDWMEKNGFDFMATGHYARVSDGKLLRSAEENKDQTYFLALLKERQLKKVLFPIGHLTKDKVRQEAKKRGLPVWDKKDSTGICFIGNDYSFSEFLKRRIKPHEGQVIDKKEKVIGTHQGIEFYTIGQRHGFKVNPRSTSSAPLFVVSKKAKKNQLIVGSKQDLAKKEFGVEKWQWIGGEPAKKNGLLFRIRHRGELVPGEIIGKKVRLTKTVFGVAPGQVAVVYDGLECLGGGVISA